MAGNTSLCLSFLFKWPHCKIHTGGSAGPVKIGPVTRPAQERDSTNFSPYTFSHALDPQYAGLIADYSAKAIVGEP
jgi:hypothetical protein